MAVNARKRERRAWRRVVVSLGVWVFFLSVGQIGMSQNSAYTVQVVAVSGQESALDLVSGLTRQGYPAYLLTVPTPQGLVYRIRVGAFANRAAAARYAAALPSVGDSRPTPALAENIPAGVSPLEPALMGVYNAAVDLQVLPWRDGVALRAQPKDEAQATYVLPDGTAAPYEFTAWRAAPQDDGTVLRVYSFPLWPEDAAASVPDRAGYRQTVLANLAGQYGLGVAALDAFVFTPAAADAAPYLVLAERFDPVSGFRERLQALGRPGTATEAGGPVLDALAGAPLPDTLPDIAVVAPLFDLGALDGLETSPGSPPQLQGDGWQAAAAGRYTALSSEAVTKPWRAVVGTPLWARGDLLVTVDGSDVLVYSLLKR